MNAPRLLFQRRLLTPLAALLLLLSQVAWAQEVGTVAAVEGTAEVQRGGKWLVLVEGSAIQQGDTLRTGRPGRVRIVFQDDTVLSLADDSQVVVDQQVFDPNRGKSTSLLGLLRGKVSAVVSEYYHHTGAEYEIKTATAVAGVRGTDFIVQYDPREQVTDVVGLSGRVEVRSTLNPQAPGVFVTAQEATSVARGQFPRPPRRVSSTLFRQYIEGVEFIGAGAAESQTVGSSLLAGTAVPNPERARTSASAARILRAERAHQPRDASGLIHQPPSVFGAGGTLRIDF